MGNVYIASSLAAQGSASSREIHVPTTVAHDDPRCLKNWLLVWLVLLNAPFAVFWYTGGPLRAPEIIAAATVAMVVRNASYSIRLLTFVALITWSSIRCVSGLFALSMTNIIDSVTLLETMNPTASLEYQYAGGLIITTLAGAVLLLKRGAAFKSAPMVLIAAFCTLVFAATDTAAKWHSRGSYGRKAPEGAAFESGIAKSGILKATTKRRHIIVVVVEALGQPSDPVGARLLLKPWGDPRLLSHYTVEHGTSAYFGSTTNAEIRELCGRWGDFDAVLQRPDRTCLPFELEKAGYETTAIHSFSGKLFQRSEWYPNVGFQNMLFSQDLLQLGARKCEGVFAGACDPDVPKILAQRLKNASKPQLLYWLTVNSHLPVLRRDGRCHEYSPELAKAARMACRVLRIYDDVASALIEEIVAEGFPDADILLVGDHMPPFFDRWNRSKFDPARVPWIILKRRAN